MRELLICRDFVHFLKVFPTFYNKTNATLFHPEEAQKASSKR
jgi:hypothetical protein